MASFKPVSSISDNPVFFSKKATYIKNAVGFLALFIVSVIITSTQATVISDSQTTLPAPLITAASKTRPILLVHGWEMWHVAKVDCADKFGAVIKALEADGFTGPFVTVTYYKDSTHCDVNLTDSNALLTKDSSWKQIGSTLSNYVFEHYSQYGQPVDLVGHSMGGLVIRSAVQGGYEKLPEFSNILVEDALTIATPHKGAGISLFCMRQQCKSLSPKNPDFAWLATNPNPQGLSHVDWSVQGSTFDALVNQDSSMGMGVAENHHTLFNSLTHNYQLVSQHSVEQAAKSLGSSDY